jgi:hypothetical protein
MDDGQKERAEELRRLYWDSTLSVREIRDRMDLTSNALYELLEPQPAGAACHVCGGEVGYRNRTTRTNRDGVCLRCGEAAKVPESKASGERPAAGKKSAKKDPGAAPDRKSADEKAGAAAGKKSAKKDPGAGTGKKSPGEDSGGGSDPDWVADAVDDALASTERAFRDVAIVAVGLVAALAVGVVGIFGRRRRG